MKYKTPIVILSLLCASLLIIHGTKFMYEKNPEKASQVQVVTSFYPVYICAMNLTENTDISLHNMTDAVTGCLHDYQMRPQDLVTLEGADLFLINGGGMESFLEDVLANYPSLNVVSTSDGIELLPSSEEHHHEHEAEHEHEHEHEHEDEDEHSYNAHVWVSPTDYLIQIENTYRALCAVSPQSKEQLTANRDRYVAKISALQKELREALAHTQGQSVVLFHDSFAYLAEELQWNVLKIIPLESDASLSAGEVAELIDELKAVGSATLFCEEQYSTQLAAAVSEETDALLYVLDTGVRGEYHADAYCKAMKNNIAVLQKAFPASKQ